MRVAIVPAVAKRLHQPRRRIAQVEWHRPRRVSADEAARGIIREVAGVRLRRHRQVENRLRQRQLALGRTEALEGLGGVERDAGSARIGKADVFPGHANNSSRQVARVSTAIEHAAEPVQGRIRRGTADRLVQGRDLVEEGIAALVEAPQALRHRLLDESAVDGGRLRRRGCGGNLLDQVEQAPRVAIGKADQPRTRIIADARFGQRVPTGPFEEFAHLVRRQRLQHVDRRPREQRRVEFERRILGRRTDERQQPTLDVRQEGILLRLVETMHFIDEEDRPPATAGTADFGASDRLTDVPDAGKNRRESDEVGSEGVRHQARERRLADSGRSPEDHAVRLSGLEGDGQRLSRPEQVRLADHFGQLPRPQSFGQRYVRMVFCGQADHLSFPSGSTPREPLPRAARAPPISSGSNHVKRFLPLADESMPHSADRPRGRVRAGSAPAEHDEATSRRLRVALREQEREREIPHDNRCRLRVSSRHRFRQPWQEGSKLKTERIRSGSDRRQVDLGRPGKLPERRRQPERRLPELNEAADISFEGFQLLLAEVNGRTGKRRSAMRG
ncbi:MAG: hypothetical protein AW07_00491 [Candidatus Accumulibacter sp. SK-11]|nr:MAG: hypothetical protein AW07_00491 [Candidatus Accumulibacter sp. SK-11]